MQDGDYSSRHSVVDLEVARRTDPKSPPHEQKEHFFFLFNYIRWWMSTKLMSSSLRNIHVPGHGAHLPLPSIVCQLCLSKAGRKETKESRCPANSGLKIENGVGSVTGKRRSNQVYTGGNQEPGGFV